MTITYLKGDVTYPIGDGNKIIPHCCNDSSKWGRGFVLALSKRWREPEEVYRSVKLENLILGKVQFICVENDIIVANMVGQHDIKPNELGEPPVRYWAIRKCLQQVNRMAKLSNSTIHCPKFGSGLSAGKWEEIEKIIIETIEVDVFVYDLI
jgi:O-acetyl-ADP-ribose deacetylase (regulator of RNase III)